MKSFWLAIVLVGTTACSGELGNPVAPEPSAGIVEDLTPVVENPTNESPNALSQLFGKTWVGNTTPDAGPEQEGGNVSVTFDDYIVEGGNAGARVAWTSASGTFYGTVTGTVEHFTVVADPQENGRQYSYVVNGQLVEEGWHIDFTYTSTGDGPTKTGSGRLHADGVPVVCPSNIVWTEHSCAQ